MVVEPLMLVGFCWTYIRQNITAVKVNMPDTVLPVYQNGDCIMYVIMQSTVLYPRMETAYCTWPFSIQQDWIYPSLLSQPSSYPKRLAYRSYFLLNIYFQIIVGLPTYWSKYLYMIGRDISHCNNCGIFTAVLAYSVLSFEILSFFLGINCVTDYLNIHRDINIFYEL